MVHTWCKSFGQKWAWAVIQPGFYNTVQYLEPLQYNRVLREKIEKMATGIVREDGAMQKGLLIGAAMAGIQEALRGLAFEHVGDMERAADESEQFSDNYDLGKNREYHYQLAYRFRPGSYRN